MRLQRVRQDLVIEQQQQPNVGASLMAQWVKNLPAMQETQEVWVRSLGQEDPLEKEMATPSPQYSCLKSPMDRGALRVMVQRVRHD